MSSIRSGLVAWYSRWPDDLRAFAILLGCALLAWWPLATFTHCVVHGDMLDCWLPWRTFIADCLQNGEWPVWNPYQQMGYPVHADLQGPAWYPETLLLGATIGQGIHVLQGLVLAYLVVAGMGMYRLAKQFCANRSAALAVALAYMLSGFFTAHVMHQYSFISGAWWPWMFAAFLRLLEKPHWRPALEAAVFQFLLLTGGNHTFTLIGFYLLLALVTVRFVQRQREEGMHAALRMLMPVLLFAATTLILSCGVLHAWWYSAPFLERIGGMEYAQAAKNPLTWPAALSFMVPWATSTGAEALGTDTTMANAHMGLLMLLVVPLAFLRQRSATENVLLVFGSVCLLASFGDALPVHRWLHGALPGLNVFRFPSYYTFFTLLCWLLPVAKTLAAWNSMPKGSYRLAQVTAAVGGTVVLLAVLCAAVEQVPMGFAIDDAHPGLYERMTASSAAERTLIHGTVQLVLVSGFILLLWKQWLTLERLVGFVALEGMIAVMLCSWQTGISQHDIARIAGIVEARPDGFPAPDPQALGQHHDGGGDIEPLWRNTNVFRKQPSHDGFNSFWPKEHATLERDKPHLFAMMKALPLAFIADSVVRASAYVDQPFDLQWGNALAVLADTAATPTVHPQLQESSCVQDAMAVELSPSSVHVQLDATCRPGVLIVQQQHLPGWRAWVDGNEMPILTVNGCAMGIPFEPGTKKVELRYNLPQLAWLRIVSWTALMLVLLALAFGCPPSKARKAGLVAVLVFAGLAAAVLPWPLGKAHTAHRTIEKTYIRGPFQGADTKTRRYGLSAIAPRLPLLLAWKGEG